MTSYERAGHRDGERVSGQVLVHLYGHGIGLAPIGAEVEIGDCIHLPAGPGDITRRWITEITEVPADSVSLDPCQAGGMPRHLRLRLVSTAPSTRKPPGTSVDDRRCMEEAVSLARQSVSEPGRVSPRVGAVIARNGIILGGAFRGELSAGEHAEFTLLEKKLSDDTLAGATLYTTLEPCTERNLPKRACVERIIDRRIGRVVIGVLDPNDIIRGRGELRLRSAGIEVSRFDSDLMSQIEELNREFFRQHAEGQRTERTQAQMMDPADPGAVGPNGHRIGYTPEGDKVEWVPDEEDPEKQWPMLLRRNDAQILSEYNEMWDRVWWQRRREWRQAVEQGEILSKEQRQFFERATEAAAQFDSRFGLSGPDADDFELGLLNGRLSALAWVLGAEWDDSLDT